MSTNPFDKIKSRLDNPSSANAGGISSSGSAYRTRLSNITKQYDEATSIFNNSYSNLKASAEAEVKAVNDRLKKQQRTQAILGTLTSLATLAPKAMSFVNSIKACKAASSNSKTTPREKQNQLQQFTQQLNEAKSKLSSSEAEVKKLDSEIADLKAIVNDSKAAVEAQKKVYTKTDELNKLEGLDDSTDETLKGLTQNIETQNGIKTEGENEKNSANEELFAANAELKQAEAMPMTVKKQTGTDPTTGAPIYTEVENTARKEAIKAAQDKIAAAKEKVKAAEDKINKAETEIKQLEKQKTKRKNEIATQIEAKKQELNAAKEENAKVASAATTLKEKETERKNKDAERARLSGEVTQFETAIAELKKAANAPSTQQNENEDPKKKKQA